MKRRCVRRFGGRTDHLVQLSAARANGQPYVRRKGGTRRPALCRYDPRVTHAAPGRGESGRSSHSGCRFRCPRCGIRAPARLRSSVRCVSRDGSARRCDGGIGEQTRRLACQLLMGWGPKPSFTSGSRRGALLRADGSLARASQPLLTFSQDRMPPTFTTQERAPVQVVLLVRRRPHSWRAA